MLDGDWGKDIIHVGNEGAYELAGWAVVAVLEDKVVQSVLQDLIVKVRGYNFVHVLN